MPLRICFATAEMAPFAKAGGLGDVSGALAKYLHAAGHDIRLFLPAYASIPRAGLEAWPVDFTGRAGSDRHARLPLLDRDRPAARLAGLVYLVHCAELFERATIYSSAADEHRRFLLLTHAMFLACQRMAFAPQILHSTTGTPRSVRCGCARYTPGTRCSARRAAC
jgi:starch synthase